MRHRSVADLMTPTAVSVQRGTPFKEIARLLKEFDISAVPVVDEADRPVGIVSEADLLRKRSSGSGTNTAADLMTRASTASSTWSTSSTTHRTTCRSAPERPPSGRRRA